MMSNLEHVLDLLAQLHALEVELPAHVARGADRLAQLPSLRPATSPPPGLLSLSDGAFAPALLDLGVANALEGRSGDSAVSSMHMAIRREIADTLTDHADDVLDQLRPAFDVAAATFRSATELGITPRTTHADILKADDVSTMRDAWAELPGATRTLDAIAEARISLSLATGLPPAPSKDRTAWGFAIPVSDWASAAFMRSAPPWRQDFEHTWQLWLRLSALNRVELLPVREASEAFGHVEAPVELVTVQGTGA